MAVVHLRHNQTWAFGFLNIIRHDSGRLAIDRLADLLAIANLFRNYLKLDLHFVHLMLKLTK